MTIAYDLFAETNPAFCTFALVNFCRKYRTVSDKPPQFALAYLAIPLALSDDLEISFAETSAATGLLSWLNRYPDIRLNLGARLDSSKYIVSDALQFSLCMGALLLSAEGTIELGPQKLPISPALPENPKKILKRAERLGIWMGGAGSAATIFSAIGVTP